MPHDLHPDLERAVLEFGLTRSATAAGYLLPDGRMLDFSQSSEGGAPTARALDHRAVERLFDDLTRLAAMRHFISLGAARLKVSEGLVGVDFANPLTSPQVNALCAMVAADRGATLVLDRRDEAGEPAISLERPFARVLDVHEALADVERQMAQQMTRPSVFVPARPRR